MDCKTLQDEEQPTLSCNRDKCSVTRLTLQQCLRQRTRVNVFQLPAPGRLRAIRLTFKPRDLSGARQYMVRSCLPFDTV